MDLVLNINNKKFKINTSADTTLLEALRKLGFKSVKEGCDTGSCGVCAVLIDGKPTLSCVMPAAKAASYKVTTVEGIKKDADEIIQHIINEGADQCGYCGPSLVLTTYAMKKELKNPTVDEINHYLAGNLCRCSGYEGQLRGIKKYMGVK